PPSTTATGWPITSNPPAPPGCPAATVARCPSTVSIPPPALCGGKATVARGIGAGASRLPRAALAFGRRARRPPGLMQVNPSAGAWRHSVRRPSSTVVALMQQGFRIAVIGAGETGTPLLKQVLIAPFVTVVGVADLDLSMPGIELAREFGVPVTDNFMELAELGDRVDVIIDVTGAPKVREALRQHMVDSGNTPTLIMHERIALLTMSLSAGRLVGSKHGHQEYA